MDKLTSILLNSLTCFILCVIGCSTSPVTPIEKKTAILTIRIDDACVGKAKELDIFIDDILIGNTEPGGSLSKEVPVGQHKVYCKGKNYQGGYYEWSARYVTITDDYSYKLGCSNSTGKTVLTVAIDIGCSGKASNISVYANGDLLGVLQPGQSASKEIQSGNATINAISQDGSTWGPFSVVLDSPTYRQNLTCR